MRSARQLTAFRRLSARLNALKGVIRSRPVPFFEAKGRTRKRCKTLVVFQCTSALCATFSRIVRFSQHFDLKNISANTQALLSFALPHAGSHSRVCGKRFFAASP